MVSINNTNIYLYYVPVFSYNMLAYSHVFDKEVMLRYNLDTMKKVPKTQYNHFGMQKEPRQSDFHSCSPCICIVPTHNITG